MKIALAALFVIVSTQILAYEGDCPRAHEYLYPDGKCYKLSFPISPLEAAIDRGIQSGDPTEVIKLIGRGENPNAFYLSKSGDQPWLKSLFYKLLDSCQSESLNSCEETICYPKNKNKLKACPLMLEAFLTSEKFSTLVSINHMERGQQKGKFKWSGGAKYEALYALTSDVETNWLLSKALSIKDTNKDSRLLRNYYKNHFNDTTLGDLEYIIAILRKTKNGQLKDVIFEDLLGSNLQHAQDFLVSLMEESKYKSFELDDTIKEIIQKATENPQDYNDQEGNDLIMLAAGHCYYNLVEYLVKSGHNLLSEKPAPERYYFTNINDLFKQNKNGQSAYEMAKETSRLPTFYRNGRLFFSRDYFNDCHRTIEILKDGLESQKAQAENLKKAPKTKNYHCLEFVVLQFLFLLFEYRKQTLRPSLP